MSQNLYRKISARSKEYKRTENFVRNEDGTLIISNDEILQKWSKYFAQLIKALVKNQRINSYLTMYKLT